MSFFAILFALLIEQARPLARNNLVHSSLRNWARTVSHNFDAGKLQHGWLAWILAVLVPSLVEGFALPVLEAMSAGVPVLVSAGAGMDEAAGPEVPGLSCTDPGEWADTIDVLAGDPGERLRRIAIGTRRAAEFTWERCARSTADAYREALDA